jgi:hypothetical protein
MFFKDKITYIKLKLLLLFVLAVNCGFGQSGFNCSATGNTVIVNGPCRTGNVTSIGPNAFEAPLPASYVGCPNPAPLRDGWFRFTAIASTATISISSTGAIGLSFVVYTGTCPSGTIVGTQIGCADNVAGTAAQTETVALTSLSIGTNYWIRAMGSAAVNSAVTCCINSPVANDEPAGAVALPPVNSSCLSTIMNLKYATQSTCSGSLAAPSCGWIGASQDIWYTVQVPASGNLFLQTNYSGTDLGIASYTGTPCASLTQIGCSEGSPEGATSGDPSLYVPGLAPGTMVYIRVWNKASNTVLTNTSTTAPPTYSLCATDLGPCGNLANNDWCSNPASMTPSAGTFSSSTTASPATYSYTPDAPGNLSATALCGNAQYNNSWYSFVATSATQTFAINTSATNCAGGITAQVFSVTPNIYGCCKTFSNVGGTCLSSSTGAATLTASSLSVGATYYIMMESQASAVESCTYTVSGWTATGILPIDLVLFKGENKGNINYIEWITSASEKNVDAYVLESSKDGIDFKKIAQIHAQQENQFSQHHYHTYDSNPYEELTYYRLRQLKMGGISELSHVIAVFGPDFYETIHNLYPNPTTSNLYFDFYSKSNSGSIITELVNYSGGNVYNNKYTLEEGLNSFAIPMEQLEKGVYILKVVSEKTGKTTHHKIIKN